MIRAVLFGTGILALVYGLTQAAVMSILSPEGAAASPQPVADAVVAKLRNRLRVLRVGDPLDKVTEVVSKADAILRAGAPSTHKAVFDTLRDKVLARIEVADAAAGNLRLG